MNHAGGTAVNRAGGTAVNRAVLRVVLAVSVLVGTVPLAAPAVAERSRPALGRLAACVQERARLDVLLLFDSSGSLAATDPRKDRIVAARAALAQLATLTQPRPDGRPTDVGVRLATFSAGYRSGGDWRALGGARQQIERDIAGLAEAPVGGVTDYAAALEGARNTLAHRAAAEPGGRCQVIVWFTDGRYEPVPRDAPGWEARTAAGIRGLCDPGGQVDRLRSDGVTLVAVGLASDLDTGDQDLLRGMAGEGGRRCGAPVGSPPGTYLAAAKSGDLLAAFGDFAALAAGANATVPCADGPGRCAFDLAPPLAGFVALIRTGSTEVDVTLRPPDGSPEQRLARGGGGPRLAEVSGARIGWVWPAPDVVLVTGALPAERADRWSGRWSVTFAATRAVPGEARVYLFTDLAAGFVEQPRFERGRAWSMRVGVTGADIGVLTKVVGIRTALSVTVTDRATGGGTVRGTVAPGPAPGVFDVTVAAPPSWRASSVQVQANLTIGTPTGVVLNPPPLVRELPVYGSVLVEPATVTLPTVTGNGSASTTVTVTAADEPACVWLDLDATPIRNPVGPLEVSLVPPSVTQERCLPLAAGASHSLTVRVDADSVAWTGRLNGTLGLRVRSGGRIEAIEVPVQGQQEKGPPPPSVWLVWLILMSLSASPVLAAWVVTWVWLRRFGPGPLRVACLRVTATVDPVDGSPVLSAGNGIRAWPGRLVFATVTPDRYSVTSGAVRFVARASANPFGEPYARWKGARGGLCAAARLSDGRPVRPSRLPSRLADLVLVRAVGPGRGGARAASAPVTRPVTAARGRVPAASNPGVPAQPGPADHERWEPAVVDFGDADWYRKVAAGAAGTGSISAGSAGTDLPGTGLPGTRSAGTDPDGTGPGNAGNGTGPGNTGTGTPADAPRTFEVVVIDEFHTRNVADRERADLVAARVAGLVAHLSSGGH